MDIVRSTKRRCGHRGSQDWGCQRCLKIIYTWCLYEKIVYKWGTKDLLLLVLVILMNTTSIYHSALSPSYWGFNPVGS